MGFAYNEQLIVLGAVKIIAILINQLRSGKSAEGSMMNLMCVAWQPDKEDATEWGGGSATSEMRTKADAYVCWCLSQFKADRTNVNNVM